jgi:predicted ATPase/transcriptional regulator with XRE-family HTH domain
MAMESPSTFGEWLRQRRSELRLTREQFASRVGCSVSALRKIEDGERRPSGQIAELLANCLNIPPPERSTFVKVARGEWSVDRLASPSQPIAGPSVSSASTTPRITLPVVPTPLIGRQREVAALSQLLLDPHCRLLTLVGPGGIGKTRLAIETAAHIQAGFADGVYFVPLAAVTSTRLIVPIIADAIGFAFPSAGPADPKAQLFSYLKQKQALLLMDNLEQLLTEPGVAVLAEVLANAPYLKLLATSRESLGLHSEWVYEIQGLPIPDSRHAEGSAQHTSVELFLQRARRAHVAFTATPEDYPAIVRICQMVDGNPLGIELAAAWVRSVTCNEIAREIARGLDFLSVSTRDLPTRHRSMRAVFDHSWRLLTQEEQGILLRLSVFQGGFRREAAEQVADATLAVLSALVTKSFIRRSAAGRYDLHELIRQFTAEHFAERPEEQSATQACHSRYYLTYFSQADGHLRSAAQREMLEELSAEMDNFRAAWDWALTHGEFALIEQTMRLFVMLYDTRGWLQEGLDMLGRAVSALERAHGPSPPDRANQVALGHLLTSQAVLATRLGHHEQALATLVRSLDILRPLHEPRVLVETITFLGLVMEFTGNYPRASECYTEGLEIATAVGDRWFAALCRLLLAGEGSLRLPTSTPENAHARLRSALADWRRIGDPRLTAIALNNLSWVAVRLGRYDEAREALEESVLLNSSIGDRWNLGFVYRGLGLIAQAQGEHLQAVDMFGKSLDTLTEVGARQDVARVLVEMSRSSFALGNDAEAERGWCEALHVTMETQGTFVALEALVGIATLKAKQGTIERALELSMIVLNHPASLHETKNRADRLRAELEAHLTSQQVEAAQRRAKAKTVEAAVEEIVQHAPTGHHHMAD